MDDLVTFEVIMKKIFYTLLFCSLCFLGNAQAPVGFSYQAIIRNTSNQLVSNSMVSIRISILQGNADGKSVFSELHTTATNVNGLVTLMVGKGIYISGDFSSVDWSKGPYFIKTETDPAGGTQFTISGTTQILSVPYALHATTADRLSTTNTHNGFKHYVGEMFEGGMIFYVYKDSAGTEHGLIASLEDLPNMPWGNAGYVGALAQSACDGPQNTLAAATYNSGKATAASECRRYRGGGFDDWYLPAIDELRIMMTHRFIFGTLLGNGNLRDVYWSSSEYDAEYAWDATMSYDVCNEVAQKTTKRGVRPVRRF